MRVAGSRRIGYEETVSERGSVRTLWLAAVGSLLVLLGTPELARAHSAGALDGYGCHQDKLEGGYHCHRGRYSGLEFKSKSEMLGYREKNLSAEAIRAERTAKGEPGGSYPVVPNDTAGWKKWIPFASRVSPQPTRADVIVPRGIQERLRVLKGLRDDDLITEDEYAAKRREILGEL